MIPEFSEILSFKPHVDGILPFVVLSCSEEAAFVLTSAGQLEDLFLLLSYFFFFFVVWHGHWTNGPSFFQPPEHQLLRNFVSIYQPYKIIHIFLPRRWGPWPHPTLQPYPSRLDSLTTRGPFPTMGVVVVCIPRCVTWADQRSRNIFLMNFLHFQYL